MELVADWAYGRPGGKNLKAAGFSGVARYLCTDPKKRLTVDEIADYRANGLAVHAVWERTAGRALDGRDAGVFDASLAWDQASAVGWRPDLGGCIYFAVDFDVSPAQMQNVTAYFDGINHVMHRSFVGVYGGAYATQMMYASALAEYLWQTAAWSKGVIAHPDLYQNTRQVTVNGVTVDINEVRSDFTGRWFSIMDEELIRRVVHDELAKSLPEFSKLVTQAVWSTHPSADVTPQVRQLADLQHWISQGLPDQIGMVGQNISDFKKRVLEHLGIPDTK